MGKSIENMNLDELRTAIDAVGDEVQQGVVALKNLATGEQQVCAIEQVVSLLKG